MSQDSFQEITTQSWFERIHKSIIGIILGFLLFIAAFPLLFWNEGRAVKRYNTLNEGANAVVSILSDRIEAGNEKKLVHMTGEAKTEEILSDPDFGITVKALRLNRVVKMYQWKENTHRSTKKKRGGGTKTITTYTYSKVWDNNLINSTKFKKPEKHNNPDSRLYDPIEMLASDVSFGAFTLSRSLVKKINNFSPLNIKNKISLPENLKDKAQFHNGGLYIGKDPDEPEIGDTQIFFKIVKPTEITLVAKQVGSTFEPYRTKAGGSIQLVQEGSHSAESMFQTAYSSNRIMTWIIRIAGFLVMMIGLIIIFRPLSVLADIIPIIGSIVGVGTGMIAFLISSVLSLVTVAIAWFVYRPVMGILLLIAAISIFIVFKLQFFNKGRGEKRESSLSNKMINTFEEQGKIMNTE